MSREKHYQVDITNIPYNDETDLQMDESLKRAEEMYTKRTEAPSKALQYVLKILKEGKR